MKLNRREKKVETMAELITLLKKRNCISDNLENVLQEHFSGFALDFILTQLKNNRAKKQSRRYSELTKQFALTLHFYSPRAYRFVRSMFLLPHPSVLRGWVSSVNCEPGYLQEVFNYLKHNVSDKPYLKECALIFDSMSIRKQLVWNNNKKVYAGYVDMGSIVNIDAEELATEALVFQIVSYTEKFKCPIAYFLVNKLSADLMSEIVRVCLLKLFSVGVLVRSVTCDGAAVNIQTLKNLGCSLNPDNFTPYFKHPANDSNVHAILDACHMLKLVRNTLAEKKIINCEMGDVKWDLILKLNYLQESESLKFANSLSGSHINFYNKKMNVSLAAQTLSSSVADAIEFLESSQHPDFQDTSATVEFIRIIDKLFDVCNSRNVHGKGFKQPLRAENVNYWKEFLCHAENFLRTLKIDGVCALVHPRKTFVLGFLMCIHGVRSLSQEFLFRVTEPLKYFLTYKLSQDHIELFFSCIRSRFGWNNNPTTLQFQSALRTMLLKNSVTASDKSNVDDIEKVSSFSVCEFMCHKKQTDDFSCDDEDISYFQALDSEVLSEYQDNIIYYISGYVVKKILQVLRCAECKELITVRYMCSDDHTYCKTPVSNPAAFTIKVNRGGLLYPSLAVFKIVQHTEKCFRSALVSFPLNSNSFYSRIINSVCCFFGEQAKVFDKAHSLVSAIDCEDMHESQLVRHIASVYLQIRLKAHTKKATAAAQGKYCGLRQRLGKLITFANV